MYRQIVGIPKGTNCAPLVADLFLFYYERDFIVSLTDNYQADIVEAFSSTPRYLDDLLNIDNPYFAKMVSQIYPTELQLNKANPSDTEVQLWFPLLLHDGGSGLRLYDGSDDGWKIATIQLSMTRKCHYHRSNSNPRFNFFLHEYSC